MSENSGQFKPGRSGNPGGRPKGYGEVRELAREHTELAIETLAAILRNQDAPPSAKASAAVAMLDRGWGKPEQTNVNVNENGTWIDFMRQLGERKEAPDGNGEIRLHS